MTNRSDLDRAIKRASAGDENAHTAVLTKILQLRWMGFDREAARLAGSLKRALPGHERHHGRLAAFDKGRQRTGEPPHSSGT